MSIKAPYLPYDELRKKATQFLADHHPSASIPVPIVAISDFQYQMDIVPIPGLQDSLETDSSISSDLTTIYVDEFVFKNRLARYRFSIAHELSHRLLHADVLAQLQFKNLAEFKAAIASIPSDQYGLLEWQAYSFAGLILVPSDHLEFAFTQADATAAAAGISIRDADKHAANIICGNIAREFQVSTAVIRKRLKFDKIIDWESISR